MLEKKRIDAGGSFSPESSCSLRGTDPFRSGGRVLGPSSEEPIEKKRKLSEVGTVRRKIRLPRKTNRWRTAQEATVRPKNTKHVALRAGGA